MRFGLVGTGHWARVTHGPGIQRSGQELVGVWGRSPERAADLAADLGVPHFSSYEDLLADVDAVAYAVPPQTQAMLAVDAARAGKHLLLDKPVALDVDLAHTLQREATARGVRSVVFFTARFGDDLPAWQQSVGEQSGWRGIAARWIVSNQREGSAYANSPWRKENGGLWDIGPHLLATVLPVAGDVTDVVAVAGMDDAVHLTLTHETGMVTTATLSLWGPEAANTWTTTLWGEPGEQQAPTGADDAADLLARAADQLAQCAAEGREHPIGLATGVRVVEILDEAAGQL